MNERERERERERDHGNIFLTYFVKIAQNLASHLSLFTWGPYYLTNMHAFLHFAV
jgi:hypothetical protein